MLNRFVESAALLFLPIIIAAFTCVFHCSSLRPPGLHISYFVLRASLSFLPRNNEDPALSAGPHCEPQPGPDSEPVLPQSPAGPRQPLEAGRSNVPARGQRHCRGPQAAAHQEISLPGVYQDHVQRAQEGVHQVCVLSK